MLWDAILKPFSSGIVWGTVCYLGSALVASKEVAWSLTWAFLGDLINTTWLIVVSSFENFENFSFYVLLRSAHLWHLGRRDPSLSVMARIKLLARIESPSSSHVRPDEFKHEESMFTLSGTKYHFFFPAYFLHLIALDSLILVSHSALIIADTITSQLGAKLSRCRARILGSSVSAIGGWRGIMKCSLFHYSCSKISIIPVQKISLFRFTKSHYSGYTLDPDLQRSPLVGWGWVTHSRDTLTVKCSQMFFRMREILYLTPYLKYKITGIWHPPFPREYGIWQFKFPGGGWGC